MNVCCEERRLGYQRLKYFLIVPVEFEIILEKI